MRKAISFRLKRNTLVILARLEKRLHTTKTDVIEQALTFYADKKLKSENPFLKHAGIFSNEEADAMLAVIRKDRRNKNIKVKL